jgi:hypothetical protein
MKGRSIIILFAISAMATMLVSILESDRAIAKMLSFNLVANADFIDNKPQNNPKNKSIKPTNSPVQFICSEGYDRVSTRRLPTTYAWTQRGKIALVRWKTEQFPGYPPQKRCEEVSPRFQEAYESGTLSFITNGMMNRQPVICTTRQYGGGCETLLMTLRLQDNSLAILEELKNVLKGRTSGPVVHSSGTARVYYQINIEQFLETAPVEEQ